MEFLRRKLNGTNIFLYVYLFLYLVFYVVFDAQRCILINLVLKNLIQIFFFFKILKLV